MLTLEDIGILMMPLTYGFVGWLTNVMALKMTFYPLKFVGILPPYLGWQGIVPRKSSGLALKAVNMLTTHLVKVEDFFSKVKPEQLKKAFGAILEKDVPQMTEKSILSLDDHLRSKLSPEKVDRIKEKALKESRDKLSEICEHLSEDVSKVFNFKALVLRNLTGNNVKYIVDIFQAVGSTEFKFIKMSGWYFGGLLGILQMGFYYAVYDAWWTLPIQGVIVGYVTNWLALRMIFRPLYEKKFLFIKYRGLFLKRQAEVSEKYAELFAEHVLNPRTIMEEILYRRVARKVVDVIQKDILAELKSDGDPKEMEALTATVEKELSGTQKEEIAELITHFSNSSAVMEKLMGRSMNVKDMIYSRMKELPPEEFEPILRSAFQEDEYVLILLGSALGAMVGLGQGLFMLFNQ